MTVIVSKPAVNLREELASLRNQGGYQEQQFYFDGLVTNGTFDADTDWTKGTGWTISGGTLNASTSGAASARQTLSLTAGASYVLSFDVVNTSGNLVISVGTSGSLYNSGASGTYNITFTAPSSSADIAFDTLNASIYTFDNVSVFEVDANDDVIHRMPKGWVPKDVYEDGLLQREGSAHDYEVVYDGFDYHVKPTVAPSATTQTCVIGVKA